nr:hypothetical protein [Tanacetum cinerariifolium]
MDMTTDQQVALDEALGMYHKKNVDFAYLLWEDFVYQVNHKDAKKSNEMYYPRFTKVIINFFMTKDPLIPRRNKSGVILPVELTNEDIRNSAGYKEYYTIASGAAPPKMKASMRKTQSSFDTTMPPSTAAGIRLLTSAKEKKPNKSSKAKGLYVLSEVALTELRDKDDDDNVDDQSEADDDDDDQEDEDEQDDDDQDDNDQDLDNDDSDDDSHGMNVGGDEGSDAEDDDEELYRDVNINLEGRDV